MLEKNKIYKSLVLPIVFIIISLIENTNVGILKNININFFFELFGSSLLIFLLCIFMLSIIETIKVKRDKYLAIFIVLMSVVSYIYFSYQEIYKFNYLLIGSLSFTAFFLLIAKLFFVLAKKLKVANLEIICLIILTVFSTFIAYKIGKNMIGKDEYNKNMQAIYIEVGIVQEKVEQFNTISKIIDLDINDTMKLHKIQHSGTFQFTNGLGLIYKYPSFQRLIQKSDYCQEWKKINKKMMYTRLQVDKNTTLQKNISFINDMCVKAEK